MTKSDTNNRAGDRTGSKLTIIPGVGLADLTGSGLLDSLAGKVSTLNPGKPSRASARPVPSHTQGSPSSQPSDSRNDGGAPAPRGGPSATPHSPLR